MEDMNCKIKIKMRENNHIKRRASQQDELKELLSLTGDWELIETKDIPTK